MYNDKFLSNQSKNIFIDHIKSNLHNCKSFYFSVSFIKNAGLSEIQDDIIAALKRGATGKVITSTYQNFTDIASLRLFLEWSVLYDGFECHIDTGKVGDAGFHTKGYIFQFDDSYELVVGSTNLTRYALRKNYEWNLSINSESKRESIDEALDEFKFLWKLSDELTIDIIENYMLQLEYSVTRWDMDYFDPVKSTIKPNMMQRQALKELMRYRTMGVDKALVISAMGTGKTYLAAFDARNFDAKRLLFIVHRETILNDAVNTFSKVFGSDKTYGFYTGNNRDLQSDFIFASSQMLLKTYKFFDPKHFDYIVFDEAHRTMSDGNQKIFEHFKPEFLLGITATPERMDKRDVFGLFENNIPYELRLRDAIINDLVVPFHYYGISGLMADYGVKDQRNIARDISKEPNIKLIQNEIEKHRPVGEKLKAIAFCTRVEHAKLMSYEFEALGYSTVSLTGEQDTGERIKAFNDLQDDTKPLEIIFTVDILNEGVDIPKVNMVLFLRPTESQTIFLQQLGRGLRKAPNKEYLTVLDFIGNNYDRSTQIILALGSLGKTTYTEKTYLKDLVKNDFKGLEIPGIKIDIDELAKEEIISYIDKTNFNQKDYLKKDYLNFKEYLKKESPLTHIDFLESGIAPDLMRFLKSSISGKNKSLYKFQKKIDEEGIPLFSEADVEIIDKISELLPLVRLDEFLILKEMFNDKLLDFDRIKDYSTKSNDETIYNAIINLKRQNLLTQDSDLNVSFINDDLQKYINDLLDYGIARYEQEFGNYEGLFKLYGNYYKEQIPNLMLKETVEDFKMKGTYFEEDGTTYVTVNLNKDYPKEIKDHYNNKFISPKILQWESESNTKIDNRSGQRLINTKLIHVFVRKMASEDNVTLPFTYVGTGKFDNMRESSVKRGDNHSPTLLFDIVLKDEINEELRLDLEVPELKAD